MNQKENLLNSLLTNPLFKSWVVDGEHEEYWAQWLKDHPGNEEIIEDAQAITRGIPVHLKEVSSSDIERSFQDLVRRSELTNHQRSALIVQWLPYAAAAVLALFVMVWLWNPTGDHQEQFSMVVTTAPGEQQDIVLPDSSIVVLNGNSTIKYNENQQLRNVTLEGEAHFHVRRIEGLDGRKPFIVSTDDISVTVLGTTFSVGADSIWTTVVLEEGKVRLQSNIGENLTGNGLIMKPDEKVVYNSKEGTYAVENLDATEYNSWTHNELSLVNRSAAEVARWMKRNFNIIIQMPDQYKTSSLTGSVDLEDPATAVKVFALALGLEPIKKGEKDWTFKEN